MAFLNWLCRCIPALSIIAWALLAFLALGDHLSLWPMKSSSTRSIPPSARQGGRQHLTFWQIAYIIYSVLAHLLACLGFPLRLCWAVWHITAEVEQAELEAAAGEEDADSDSESEKSSSLSAGFKDVSTPDNPLSRVGTPKPPSLYEVEKETEEVVMHAIILPSYKEDIGTLRETLAVLASHRLARLSYDVYLAMEERDPDAEITATALITVFANSFHNISFTLHPGDISGEVAGKSSNVSWAARQLSHNYADYDSRNRCIITVMDSDTHLKSSYFILLTKYHHESQPQSASTMYVTPIVFDRNAHEVNPLVRTADIFWCGAGLSGLYKSSPICIPTSVYSIAMPLAGQVGGWDTGPESIGEDLHMYLKCYFASSGHFHTRIIYSPASQSNVSSDVKGWRRPISNIQARYRQAMRHMWGALDTGYAFEKLFEAVWRRNDVTLSSWLSNTDDPAERVPRWIKSSNLTHFTPPNLSSSSQHRTFFSKTRLVILFHRLYEAHFLPGHLTIALVSALLYTAYIPAAQIHPLLLWSFGFNGTLRLLGFLLFSVYLYLYEFYHALCVQSREDEMKKARLYESMEGSFSRRPWKRNLVDYCLLPVTGTMFGTVPAFMAEMSHFWTDRLVYTVSAKPQSRREAEKVLELA